jgi:hypothetical protein
MLPMRHNAGAVTWSRSESGTEAGTTGHCLNSQDEIGGTHELAECDVLVLNKVLREVVFHEEVLHIGAKVMCSSQCSDALFRGEGLTEDQDVNVFPDDELIRGQRFSEIHT